MGFYEQISKYYDYIFPVDENQFKFIIESVGVPGKSILDVACGSGGYSVELAKAGYNVTATDIEEKMVSAANDKAVKLGVRLTALKADMKDIGDVLKGNFDGIFCIGNSIVHLGSLNEILNALRQMHKLLNAGGKLLLQTINYDRIIKYNISSLPTIRNEAIGLEFIRNYEYANKKELINFNTILAVNGENGREVFHNSIELLPLRHRDALKLLQESGFHEIEFYGGFDYQPYDEDAYMMVVRAVKK